ncbi:hypothetical protein GCM10010347_01470 [Streptomyces cirratus]|uniref:Lipoprotein n=1 Tax=Streptomyces cirratus TaxID=68187 RepID=A0ABQ3EGI4_9ACTN|nr:hypothetical protein GCM10010347_01470 [Streptomyces cirratus]
MAALALCATLALTGCNGDKDAGAAGPTPASTPSATPALPSAPAGGAPPSPTKPTAKATPVASASASATAPGKPKASAPVPACASKAPASPDEIAVYRYTPEGGFHGLIVKHGHWGCPGPGGAAHFETVGEETYLPIAEDAKITALTPIVASTVSKPITVHELSEWLIAHPDKGLVFHYNVGKSGAIETLGQEEYTV